DKSRPRADAEAAPRGVRDDGAPPPDAPPKDGRKDEPKDEREVVPLRRPRPKMISLTLLDGTTISLPAPARRRPSKPDVDARAGEELSDQLTARDLVSALRAVSHGVDASEILGAEPRWEAMFSALLSILLRKGLIADWEFVEEFRKV
ncbi:MAG: hypothetical protein M3O36_10630, partial [Myxococcota bacterium]|nr:hypothetical protein [Myxococcota bacterium]